jgi:hypothetical protein
MLAVPTAALSNPGHEGAHRQPSAPKPLAFPWKVAALLTFVPVTAILHHRIFSKPHCMTNLLSSRAVFVTWVKGDASPWLGLVAALVAFVTVSRKPALRFLVAAFPIAFFPLSLWIWDIPGTSVICPHFHDGKIGLRSWHLYLLGAILYLPIAWLLSRNNTRPPGLDPPGL